MALTLQIFIFLLSLAILNAGCLGLFNKSTSLEYKYLLIILLGLFTVCNFFLFVLLLDFLYLLVTILSFAFCTLTVVRAVRMAKNTQ